MPEQQAARNLIAEIHRRLIDSLATGPARVMLHGGRGMGKTSVLLALLERFEAAGLPVRFITGRTFQQAWESVRAPIEGDRLHVMIDDLDYLLMHPPQAAAVDIEHGFTVLQQVAVDVQRRGGRFLVASTLPPSRLTVALSRRRIAGVEAQLLIDAFSSLLTTLDTISLNPWFRGWNQSVTNLIERHLDGLLKPSVLASCQRVLLDLTGGHPALLASGLAELERIAGTARSQARAGQAPAAAAPAGQAFPFAAVDPLLVALEAKGSQPELEALLRQHLEDHLVRTGLLPLRRAIASLRVSEVPTRRRAYLDLIRLVEEEITVPPILSREILLDEGLIYKEMDTGNYGVPGDLLRQEVLRGKSPAAPGDENGGEEAVAGTPRLTLEADELTAEQSGALVIESGGGSERVRLSGHAWSILKLLVENPQRTFSLRELLGGSSEVSESAARSAIQRLEAKLSRAGLAGLCENVWGKGYRLNSSFVFRRPPGR